MRTNYPRADAVILLGSAGNDKLMGSIGNDTIVGSIGNDTIVGGAGQDNLTGGQGEDSFFFAGGSVTPDTPDSINDFCANDETDVLKFDGSTATGFDLVDGSELHFYKGVTSSFSVTDNVVVVTTAAAQPGHIDSAKAAAVIGNATGGSAYTTGAKVLFIVSNGSNAAVFLFTSDAADGTVLARELGTGPIIELRGVDSTKLVALTEDNFAFGISPF